MDALMVFWIFLIGIIAGLIIGLTIVYKSAVYPLKKRIDKLIFEKQSLLTTNEKSRQQFTQITKDYPYEIKNFRFIGNPIDGIQFNENKILFVEFKKNKLKHANIKSNIKKLLETGKIEWFEF